MKIQIFLGIVLFFLTPWVLAGDPIPGLLSPSQLNSCVQDAQAIFASRDEKVRALIAEIGGAKQSSGGGFVRSPPFEISRELGFEIMQLEKDFPGIPVRTVFKNTRTALYQPKEGGHDLHLNSSEIIEIADTEILTSVRGGLYARFQSQLDTLMLLVNSPSGTMFFNKGARDPSEDLLNDVSDPSAWSPISRGANTQPFSWETATVGFLEDMNVEHRKEIVLNPKSMVTGIGPIPPRYKLVFNPSNAQKLGAAKNPREFFELGHRIFATYRVVESRGFEELQIDPLLDLNFLYSLSRVTRTP
jgi:hypothetical protein